MIRPISRDVTGPVVRNRVVGGVKDLKENYIELDGIRFCYFETGLQYQDDGTILLVHATGFHARCWDRTIGHLQDRHVVAIDMRGHGRSDNVEPFSWDRFGQDVTEFVVALDLRQIVGAGHSMGGHSVTRAAANVQERFSRLVLIDPVILDPAAYAQRQASHSAWLNEGGEHPVARRRNWFESPEAMFDNFAGRGSYGLWREDVLKDYCDYGILPDPESDGFVLACPPLVEAAIYMGSSGANIYEAIETIEMPVTVLRAREREAVQTTMDFSTSPTFPQLASRFKNGTDVHLSHLTHFIPMQAPQLVARYILDIG